MFSHGFQTWFRVVVEIIWGFKEGFKDGEKLSLESEDYDAETSEQTDYEELEDLGF